MAIVAALIGAVVGAWISGHTARKVDKERRTWEVLTSFQRDVFPLQGIAYSTLAKKDPDSPSLDKAKSLGNWFEIFAVLVDHGLVEEKLVQAAELDKQMECFLNRAKESQAACDGHISPCKDWPNLWRIYGDN